MPRLMKIRKHHVKGMCDQQAVSKDGAAATFRKLERVVPHVPFMED